MPNLVTHRPATVAKQQAFLNAYMELGVISHAARAVGISPRMHYDWMRNSEYAEEFEEAYLFACDVLEAEARRRATEGVKEYLYFKDEPILKDGEHAYKLKYSDSLLMFLLKGALPDKYAERKQITNKDGGTLELVEEIITSPDQIIVEGEAIEYDDFEPTDESGLI